MRAWTLLLLVVLVGGLLWLRFRRDEEQTSAGTVAFQVPLLPGFDGAEATRLRIDHLERGVEVVVERDGYGRWHLVEPLAYPAEGALLSTLFGYLEHATGPVVRGAELEELALAPPRVVVQVTTRAPGEGAPERTWRLEVGSLDVDARLVYARVPGHPEAPASEAALVTRVVRSIDTTLDRNPDDYREASVATIPAGQVSELTRGGDDAPGLYFEAFRDGALWRRTDEPRVALDPTAIGILLRAVTSIRVERFADDDPDDVTRFGLDRPRYEIELVAPDGRRELILFGSNAEERDLPFKQARWYAQRVGFPHVFEVRANDVLPLSAKTESLYDYALVRTAEQDVLRVELTTRPADGEPVGLLLERLDDGWWVEAVGPLGGARRPADADRVGSLVAALVQAELGEYAPPGTFAAGDAPRRLVVRTTAGSGIEATLGAVWSDPESGVEGRLLRRSGEDVAATAPEALLELYDLTLADLEDRVVHAVSEGDVDRIELRHDGATHVYRRVEREWTVGERAAVPGKRVALLERLLGLEAERWLDDVSVALEDPLFVSMSGRESLAFTLGRLPDGTLAVDTPDRRARLPEDPLQGDLHAALLETFR